MWYWSGSKQLTSFSNNSEQKEFYKLSQSIFTPLTKKKINNNQTPNKPENQKTLFSLNKTINQISPTLKIFPSIAAQ